MKNRPFLNARTVLAIAALSALSSAAPLAQALGVGRLNVQSALGEGMRAEIDITSLTPDEAASLAVRIASPDTYRAAGVDYNAVLAGTQATVVRRADGRAVLRISSDRAVQEPFIELILELNSASGRLVREFTLLFDPPGNRAAPPVQAGTAVAPVFSAAPMPAPLAQAAPRPAPQARVPAATTATAAAPMPAPVPGPLPAAPRRPKPAPAPAPLAAEAPARVAAPARGPAAAAAAPITASGKQYPVRQGDTLYRVAGRTQPAGVSLDQMLVGLYRANPDAFISNNVNKLRAGAVLSVPTADEVRDVTPSDMHRLITAQSVDFSAYRNRLAQSAPLAVTPDAGRQAQGKVQAAVDDRKQAAMPSPDKLKLSGGAASAPAAPGLPGGKDNATRVAELSRNVEDLKKLQQGTAAVQAPGAPAPAPAPAVVAAPAPAMPVPPPAPIAAPPVAAAPAPVVLAASQAAPAVLPAPVPVASSPVPVPSPLPALPMAAKPLPPVALPSPAPGPETSLLDSLSSNPLLLPGAGLLALALAAFGAWKLRGRFTKSASETSFLESRMQPDSFFGASGGQHVDTRDGGSRAGSSSMGYSLSQLDAIGDVDPVAEADVYLAYGRDLQAEEILKEAMRTTPERLSVRTKLLEVYAKRRDTKGFELLATQLYALTKGMGTDWDRSQEMGRQIDPDNQLYQQGGHPEEIILDGERVVIEPLGATTQPHSVLSPVRAFSESRLPQLSGAPSGFDLDLDLDQPDETQALRARQALEATRPMAPTPLRSVDNSLDFSNSVRGFDPQRSVAVNQRNFDEPGTVPASLIQPTIPADLDLDSFTMDLDDGKGHGNTTLTQPTLPGRAADSSLARFDPTDSTPLADTRPDALDDLTFASADPLARKLELADEFRQIGDMDGARDLLEEVVSKAAGNLRARAQAMLDTLG